MSRKRTRRRVVIPMAPRGLRPKLTRDQVRDLAICHLQNLDAVAFGDADEGTLWQIVGAVLTWSRVAEMLQLGAPEMIEQMNLVESLIKRFGEHGKVRFTGTEYQLARAGVDVMDQLAETVDMPTAVIAAEWSEARVNKLEAACRERDLIAGQRAEATL